MKGRTTLYRGVEMRSRLEASYAAWLDSLDVEWAYEPLVFADGDVQWLPDFEVATEEESAYVEVKSNKDAALAAMDRVRCAYASISIAQSVLIVYPATFPASNEWWWTSVQEDPRDQSEVPFSEEHSWAEGARFATMYRPRGPVAIMVEEMPYRRDGRA